MPKYRAQIIWEFEFDENGLTQNEYDYLEEDDDFSRTPEEMAEYAKTELYDYISDYHTDLWNAISVEKIEE